MSQKTAISLKAVFLLIVFFLNTAIGFACAVQSGLLTTHHHDMHQMHVKHHNHKEQTHRCCGDGMVKFALVDKSKSYQDDSLQSPVFALLFPVLNLNILPEGHLFAGHRYTALRQYPPPVDIYVSVRSFRI